MGQLIMRWKNDGKKMEPYTMPEGYTLTTLPRVENGVDAWLDIIQYGLSDGRQDESCYIAMMVNHDHYDENRCFFVMQGDEAIATITVICDYENKEGYIHMVACKESCRGKGIGSLLNQIALYELKKEGMETAYLTTDDWRLPAIKSYLRVGFEPDLSTDEFRERWKVIYELLGLI